MTPADKAIRKRCCILYFSMQCDQLIQHNETCKISYIIRFNSHSFPYGKTDAIRLTTKDLIKKKDLQKDLHQKNSRGEIQIFSHLANHYRGRTMASSFSFLCGVMAPSRASLAQKRFRRHSTACPC